MKVVYWISKPHFRYQGHPTIIFGEICVRASQTILRTSVLRCQTATDIFTKTSPKKTPNQRKVGLYVFGKGIFALFRTFKCQKKVTQNFRMSKLTGPRFDCKF